MLCSVVQCIGNIILMYVVLFLVQRTGRACRTSHLAMMESATQKIGEFHRDPKSWTSYMEQLKCYFVSNNVADARKQRTILLSCCGAFAYSPIWSLAMPSKPTDVAYKDLVEKVTAYFAPRRSRIVSRFKFNLRSQQSGESIAIYVLELQKLSEFCEH